MSVESDKLPPVPQHDPPISKGGPFERFTSSWMRWFLQVKAKVDVINESVTNLSQLVSGGFAVKDEDGTWESRTITGAPNQIEVTDGDGIAGNPTIRISESYAGQGSISTVGTITSGTWNGTTIAVAHGGTGATTPDTARNNLGAAAKMQVTGTTAIGGTADALPAQPVGYVEVDIGGVTKRIPYYD